MKGEMYLTERVEYSKKEGEKYLHNFEVEMILAMILRDGRYNGHVTIIPFKYTQQFQIAFSFYQNCERYDSARKSVDAGCALLVEGLRKEGKEADEIKVQEEIYMKPNWWHRFRDLSKEEWIQKYNGIQRDVIDSYLAKNLKLCSERSSFFQVTLEEIIG